MAGAQDTPGKDDGVRWMDIGVGVPQLGSTSVTRGEETRGRALAREIAENEAELVRLTERNRHTLYPDSYAILACHRELARLRAGVLDLEIRLATAAERGEVRS